MDLSRLTNNAKTVLTVAVRLAEERGNQEVQPLHVLAAILADDKGAGRDVLVKAGADASVLEQKTQTELGRLPQVQGATNLQPTPSKSFRSMFDTAVAHAEKRGDQFVTVEHLVLAVAEADSPARRLIADAGVTSDALAAAVKELRGSQTADSADAEDRYKVLEKYGRDLTAVAREGKLDPVIGRDEEIRRVIQILSRRTKNNPVLIGEPGVGKTAIVEGLAQRIAVGDVPETLKDRMVWSLDIGSLLAGAKYRGEFEERFKAVLKEVSTSEGRIVMFIDEMHTIVGAGKGDGAIDAGNLMKPMLARGELRVVGATTLDEYRTGVEEDPALERRFSPVYVDEPSAIDTIGILRGLKERYEVHHKVRITDAALVAAAQLSHRYITDRFLPDKAIDLIDEAAATLRLQIDSRPAPLDAMERKIDRLMVEVELLKRETDDASKKRLEAHRAEIDQLQAEAADMREQWEAEKRLQARIGEIKESIERTQFEAEQAERSADYELAARLRYGQLGDLQRELDEVTSQLGSTREDGHELVKEQVDEDDIADVVSRWTGIPVSRLTEGEVEKLLNMEERLHQRVIGQDEAVVAVSNALRRSRSGLQDEERPIGSFLFLGPSGVGKTELARALAELMFDDPKAMVRIDMSEYMEKHAVSRLIGAPPGYIGYDEGGQLTEAVRRRPYCVLLLDEVEKAHPDVFNILLQLLDEGRLTDSQGRTVDFRNAIVIMTSNLGSSHLALGTMGDEERAAVMAEVRAHFRPELLNRIDEISIFGPLSRDQLRKIVDLQLARLVDRLAAREVTLEVTDAAKDRVAMLGYDPAYGARPLKRVIQRQIENPMAELLLEGSALPGGSVVVDSPAADGDLVISSVAPPETEDEDRAQVQAATV